METLTSPAQRAEGQQPGGVPGRGSQRMAPKIGLVLGPVLAVLLFYFLPEESALPLEARSVAAIAVLVAVWWMTEALPLAVTALLPLILLPLSGAVTLSASAAPYASPIVFLFMGGFVIAIALQRWNMHLRIALSVLSVVGTKPRSIVLGTMLVSAFLSMWVNNTATTVMMIPIALSLVALAVPEAQRGKDQLLKAVLGDRQIRNFTLSLLLGVAYASSMGGLATPVGSTPNLILMGFLDESMPERSLSFAQWMMIGAPVSAIFVFLGWLLLTRVLFPSQIEKIAGGKARVRQELAALGPMSRQEWMVSGVFVLAALLWVFRGTLTGIGWLVELLPFLPRLTDDMIAVGAAVLLFLLPGAKGERLLDWPTVQQGIPWGALLLFGGGLSLAAAVQSTKLNDYIGLKVSGLGGLPIVLLVIAICVLILLLTELTSNTATAATFIPVLAAVATGIGVDPLFLLLPVAMAASCAFMLPVGTPPNAIAYGTGYIPIGQMIRVGLLLNVLSVVLITGAVFLLGVPLLGLGS